jgi:hypothetical protein
MHYLQPPTLAARALSRLIPPAPIMRVHKRLQFVVATFLWVFALPAIAGAEEDALVTYYYQSILNRTPASGEVSFWSGEISRLRSLGQEPEEVFFAMSNQFFGSVEYTDRHRTVNQQVNDLYQTFLQRAPEAGGLEFWSDVLQQGVPLGVVLAGFQFSLEFQNFAQSHLTVIGARPEGSLVLDFYRGYLNRLPEPGGFEYWVQQFRAGQCSTFTAFKAQADAIANGFQTSTEYLARNRSNAEFVGDLYSAFMRRAAEAGGLAYWTDQLNRGLQSRAMVRQGFLDSPEFQGRLFNALQAGCFTTILLGTDADTDGVRDDIQKYITQTYASSTKTQKAVSQLARSLQERLLVGTTAGTGPAGSAFDSASKAFECLSYVTNGNASAINKALLSQALDNVERLRAYIHYNELLAGQVIQVRRPDQWKASCSGFDPDLLPN